MALQTFTAGQVLTAAQVTALQANDYNQTVNNYTDSRTLTIADLGDRVVMNKATATTITVNTGIFAAGDTLWIHNIGVGVCTITAGTATVSTSGSLALAQNQGGTLYFTSAGVAIFFPSVQSAGGLVLLNTTSFSGVASVSLPAGTFSSTYDNYKIVCDFQAVTSDADTSLRVRAAGTDLTSSNYVWGRYFVGAANSIGFGTGNNDSGTAFNIGSTTTTAGQGGNFDIEVHAPMLARRTTIKSFGVGTAWGMTGGIVTNTTAYDSLTFFLSGQNITGTIRAYGYQN